MFVMIIFILQRFVYRWKYTFIIKYLRYQWMFHVNYIINSFLLAYSHNVRCVMIITSLISLSLCPSDQWKLMLTLCEPMRARVRIVLTNESRSQSCEYYTESPPPRQLSSHTTNITTRFYIFSCELSPWFYIFLQIIRTRSWKATPSTLKMDIWRGSAGDSKMVNQHYIISDWKLSHT